MTWLHDNAVTFSNWEDGSLTSDLAAMDKCAALHTNTGKWEIVSCSDDLENGVICEAAQGEISFLFLYVALEFESVTSENRAAIGASHCVFCLYLLFR